MMVMLEACDKMPDGQKKQQLQAEFDSLLRSVLEWQDPESHLWYNVMTRRDDLAKNRPETSGSAMLTYCLLKGYHDGILKDEEFRNAGITAFNAMVENYYNETDGLTDTLISMGPASKETDYQNPQFVSNEAKGVAPLIMAAKYVLP
jgi:rhamnogalacturonyl hydrolase YesR